ncbi:antitoxin VapB family protein [Candidatus Woesearchaeota archaeon]|nr:antitoxin VapB family protein [Candidatus Woesearchaeota archaeon]
MATKTITVTEKAYEALSADKKNDESFSEVILRTHKRKGNWEALSRFIGAWEHVPEKTIDEMKAAIDKLNKNSMKSVERKIRGI